MSYGISARTALPFADAVASVREALKQPVADEAASRLRAALASLANGSPAGRSD